MSGAMPPVHVCGGWAALSAALAGVLVCTMALAATPVVPASASSGTSAPATADQSQAERARIAAQRRSADAEFSAAQAACLGRFLLTPCLDDAREIHRTALERQRRQLLLVDDAARRQRSADRLQLLQRRAAEVAPNTGPAALATRGPAQGAAQRATSAASAAQTAALAGHPASARLPGAAAAQQQRQQAKAQADYQQRQQAIQAHRQAVTVRNARQDAQHPPAAGLPLPPPATSAAAR